MTIENETTPLKPWTEPRVDVLDVADSEIYLGRGKDGYYFPNSTRS